MEYIWIKWKMKAFWKGEFDASKKKRENTIIGKFMEFSFSRTWKSMILKRPGIHWI